MLSKLEMFGIALSVLAMALALYLIQIDAIEMAESDISSQKAQLSQTGVVVLSDTTDSNKVETFSEAIDETGNVSKLVIEDVSPGSGDEVEEGDVVVVNYVGKLQNGQEFDNSIKRGEPFTFKVGQGKVISGWETGVIGMRAGGQRVLVIPPEMAYGDKRVGPIPPNSTLLFVIELLEIK